MVITTEKELGQDLKNDKNTITIEGDLVNKVIIIKAVGPVSWVIAIGSVTAVLAIIVTTGPAGTPAALGVAGAGVVGILGFKVALSAVLIAFAAGGANSLNKLRNYKITQKSKNRLVLKRK